jgi:hypothetical protein
MLQPPERTSGEDLVVLVVERPNAAAEFEQHAIHALELLGRMIESEVRLEQSRALA